jgi:sulfide:quinone oxidoreductase
MDGSENVLAGALSKLRAMSLASPSKRLRVLLVGGGVASLEAALTLRELAAEQVSLTLLTPSSEFIYRPMTVREPFAYARAQRLALSEIAADTGAELVSDALASVDPQARLVHTAAGLQLPYDALLIGLGARISSRYEHAVTIDDGRLDELLHGLIQDIEEGYVKRLALIVPAGITWPLPVYELALMAARRAEDMDVKLATTILTPEDSPLAIFGEGVSQAVSEILAQRGVEVITSAYSEVPIMGKIEIAPGDRRLEVDRVIAMPTLHGPRVGGLPADPDGFIPIDEWSRVPGAEGVYAAGDATDFAVKFGGIAAQQADAAAESIAALAGAQLQPQPFHPVIEAVLLTGDKPLRLRADVTGGHGGQSSSVALVEGPPPPKIAARYLAPYLQSRTKP